MEEIFGKIIKYLFHNPQNSYSIILLKLENKTTTVSGYFPILNMDLKYKFSGEYKKHPKYGMGFVSTSYETYVEPSKSGVVSYLSSGLFQGVGEKTALKIYDALGDDAIEKILNDINVLDQVKIKESVKLTIYHTLKDNRDIEKTLIKLYDYGLTSKMAMKIYEKYRENTIDIINENPYILVKEIEGFNFLKADAIALKLEFNPLDERRIEACIIHVLDSFLNNKGSSYCFYDQIMYEAIKYLRIDEFLIDDAINNLIGSDLVLEDDRYYLKYVYEVERKLEARLRMFAEQEKKRYPDYMIENAIDYLKNHSDITYTDEQIGIMKNALNSNFSVITGGPGTGKTTLINGILKAYLYLNNYSRDSNDILMIAPTGRASQRMSEKTKFASSTIHKALGYQSDNSFVYGPYQPLWHKLVIIDESSMIDMFLAYQLFGAIKTDAQVILVGDYNQLPSVGPGQVLKEIIESNLFDVYYLTKIFRQFKDSPIIKMADDCLNERMLDVDIECDSTSSVKHVMKTIKDFLNEGYNLSDIEILSPMYKGDGGIDNLNSIIQQEFNHNEKMIKLRERAFKVNDRVLQNVNSSSKRLMNGDVGIIKDIIKTADGEILLIDFNTIDVDYEREDLDELSLAYAMSVHKSQGSEFKIVIFVCLNEHYIMLKRNLIYTAITRAKEQLIIIGNKKALNKGILDVSNDRQTSLFKNNLTEISPYDFL